MSTGRGGVAVRTSDSLSKEPGFESSCCPLETISFTPLINSALNVYLATYSGGYVNEYSSHTYCSVAESFPEKSSWHWIELVCQGVNCNTF